MAVLRGDKVVLTKAFKKMDQTGNLFEVADFTGRTVIIRDEKTKVAVGAVNVDEFYEYFEHSGKARGKWSGWNKMIDPMGNIIALYRTNYKKVQVRIRNSKLYQAEASCNLNTDEFDLSFGIRLAYLRCEQKVYKDKIKDYSYELERLRDEIKHISSMVSDNDKMMKNMLKMLDKKSDKENREC